MLDMCIDEGVFPSRGSTRIPGQVLSALEQGNEACCGVLTGGHVGSTAPVTLTRNEIILVIVVMLCAQTDRLMTDVLSLIHCPRVDVPVDRRSVSILSVRFSWRKQTLSFLHVVVESVIISRCLVSPMESVDFGPFWTSQLFVKK